MSATKVTVYDRLEALPDDAQKLFDAAGAESFYHSMPWYHNFVAHALDPGDETRFYVLAEPGGATLAVLPLRAVREAGSGAVTLSSLSNYYTSLFGPILRASVDPSSVLDEVVRAIVAERPRWACLKLNPLAHDGLLFKDLEGAFRRAGVVPQPYFSFGNWYLEVGGRSAEEYLRSLPSQLRNTLKRKAKKLASAGRARLTIVTGGYGLEQALTDYEHVYAASWKVPEPYPGFVPGLIRTCARMGWLRLGLLYVDGEPAAAQLWVVSGTTASIFKLAYQDKFGELSVGSILTAHLMQHVIDTDRVSVVDYLTGDDGYKRDWMSHRRERWGIVAFNPRTARGVVGILRHVAGRSLKRTVRTLLSNGAAPATASSEAPTASARP
jgi:CelD/BcsL family acetyltransferase involved in cellulose biosynthesis